MNSEFIEICYSLATVAIILVGIAVVFPIAEVLFQIYWIKQENKERRRNESP